ncbi:hypothetical protein Q0M94_18725 (plasmid) [Deinococcus radiomollis]|uniref:hypothetical protein n=1 Tax=Deinococcus radiomollis TaxID=468916 RepID=UPI0038917D03
MSDIKNALAQLRAARNGEEALSAYTPEAAPAPAVPSPPAEPVPEPAQTTRGEIKTLAGRVPLPLHRELTRGLLDAADELKVSKINIDEALEAAIRVVLREGAATQLWYAQLREVRRERREG